MRIEFKWNCLKQDKVTFTPNNVMNLFIVLFGAIKLSENADLDKKILFS